MSAKLRQRVDPEDVVQSAFHSFFIHARGEEYLFEQAGDLWRLLAAITIHKLHRQIERHTAAKRDIGREHRIDRGDNEMTVRVVDVQPTADEAVALVEQVQLILKRMPPVAQKALELRLSGESFEDIANAIGRSPRTVRRLVNGAKREIEVQLNENRINASGGDECVRWPVDARATLDYSDFRLEKLVGTGGMGKVYRARQQSLSRLVAIKALHKKWQRDRKPVEAFVNEALVVSRLDHPNIVKTYGLGQFPSGSYFLAMEFFPAGNLKAMIQEKTLAVRRALDVFRQIVEAVAYVHEHGIVHCDIKPANVLFDRNGRVAVSDFGFAQLMGRSKNSEDYSLIGGTRGYAAPELLTGRRDQIRPTVDVYSLGALLKEMIARHPSGLADAGMSSQSADNNEYRIVELIALKCLSVRPRLRYESAGAIREELKATFCR